MNDTLREKEELLRLESTNYRKAAEELAALKKKVDQHKELMAEKDRTALVCPLRTLAFASHCVAGSP
jgi:autophagy-related protein 16-1